MIGIIGSQLSFCFILDRLDELTHAQTIFRFVDLEPVSFISIPIPPVICRSFVSLTAENCFTRIFAVEKVREMKTWSSEDIEVFSF